MIKKEEGDYGQLQVLDLNCFKGFRHLKIIWCHFSSYSIAIRHVFHGLYDTYPINIWQRKRVTFYHCRNLATFRSNDRSLKYLVIFL